MNTPDTWDDANLFPIGGLRSSIAFAMWNLGSIAAKYEDGQILFLFGDQWWSANQIKRSSNLSEYMYWYMNIILQIQNFYYMTDGHLDLPIIDPIYFGV